MLGLLQKFYREISDATRWQVSRGASGCERASRECIPGEATQRLLWKFAVWGITTCSCICGRKCGGECVVSRVVAEKVQELSGSLFLSPSSTCREFLLVSLR